MRALYNLRTPSLLQAEASRNTVIVAGIGGEMYSQDDGKTWRHSIGGGISQSVRYIGPIGKGDGLHFGIAGQHGAASDRKHTLGNRVHVLERTRMGERGAIRWRWGSAATPPASVEDRDGGLVLVSMHMASGSCACACACANMVATLAPRQPPFVYTLQPNNKPCRPKGSL